MAAPKNNQFWKLRSKHGRDKIFTTPEDLWKAACEYFENVTTNPIVAEDNKGTKNLNEVKFIRPFTIKGFCLFCDTSESWWKEFKKGENIKDFLPVIHKIEETIYNQKFEGAAIGLFHHNIIARDLGLKDGVDAKVTGELSIIHGFNYITPNDSDTKTNP